MKKNILFLLFALLSGMGISHAQGKVATIRFYSNIFKNGDKISFQVLKYGYGLQEAIKFEDSTEVQNGNAKIRLSFIVDQPCYISFSPLHHDGFRYQLYLVSPGDDITIHESVSKIFDRITDHSCTFSGPGANSFAVQWQCKQVYSKSSHFINNSNIDSILSKFKYTRGVVANQFKLLHAFKHKLSPGTYNLLLADQWLYSQNNILNHLDYCLQLHDPAKGPVIEEPYINSFAWFLAHGEETMRQEVSNAYLTRSQFFTSYTEYRYRMDSCDLVKKPFSAEGFQSYILKNFQGSVREKLLVRLVSQKLDGSGDLGDIVRSSIPLVKTPDLKAYLTKIENSRITGANVSDFSLPDTSGSIRHLSEFKGKVVVIDTWHNGCGPCRSMAPELKKVEQLFKSNKNVVFISIECDNATPAQHMELIHGGEYCSSEVLNLVASPKNPFLKSIYWDGDPTLLLVDKNGKFGKNPQRPDADSGSDLITKINMALKN